LNSVATVILSWECPAATIRCATSVIDAYATAGMKNGVIVIVDNGSSPPTVEALREWHESSAPDLVQLHFAERNEGFSVGMNRGIGHCRQLHHFDFYWLLNNDLHVEPDALGALAHASAQSPGTVLWGPTIISEKNHRIECAGGCRYYPSIGYFRAAHAGRSRCELAQLPEPRIDYIYGAAMFVQGDFLARSGNLDEAYFLYYEELVLARRLLPGESMGWCRSALVHHIGAGSSVIPGVDQFKARQATLSALQYTRDHHPWFLLSVCLARLMGLSIRGLLHRNRTLPLAAFEAIVAFFSRRDQRPWSGVRR